MTWIVTAIPGRQRQHRYSLALPDEARAVAAARTHVALLAGHIHPWGDPYAVVETDLDRAWEVISPYGETLHTVVVTEEGARP